MSIHSGNTHQGWTEAQLAEKRAEAYRLRLRGLSLREVGRRLGVSHQTVSNWTKQAADELIQPLASELRQQQADRLDAMQAAVMGVLEAQHYVVSNGRLIRLSEDAPPLEDDGPVLAAVDRLLRIEERRSRLFGLDAPERSEVSTTVEQISPNVLSLIEAAERDAEADVAAVQAGTD
jgi:transcriptional regulator with XRE-family HTH domain